MKINKISFIIIIVLLASQIAIFIYFDRNFEIARNELNKTENSLENKINENYMQTQGQIEKLTESLASTQQDLSKQISQLKASASADFSGIIEQAVKAVVSIKTDVSQGSGFFINTEGYVVTNAHVLSNAKYAKILTYDKGTINSALVGYDSNADIALLKISGNYNYLEFGDSSNAKVGEKVIAVGNPYGLSFSVTEGIISALHRKFSNIPYIQTDVPLNPGNSGGALINKEGKVIGITNFKISEGESLGFALESNYVSEIINEISLKAINMTIIFS